MARKNTKKTTETPKAPTLAALKTAAKEVNEIMGYEGNEMIPTGKDATVEQLTTDLINSSGQFEAGDTLTNGVAKTLEAIGAKLPPEPEDDEGVVEETNEETPPPATGKGKKAAPAAKKASSSESITRVAAVAKAAKKLKCKNASDILGKDFEKLVTEADAIYEDTGKKSNIKESTYSAKMLLQVVAALAEEGLID